MCGRYTLALPAVQVQNRFQVTIDESRYRMHYNGAPGQQLPVITDAQPHELNWFRWGLIPFWAKDVRIGYQMINARSETLMEKPSFKVPLQRQRCLVIADSFYEWQTIDKKTKLPYRIMLRDKGLFAMAGLWSTWKDAEERPIHSFTIITVPANNLIAGLHDRMPAILDPEAEQEWLSPSATPDHLLPLLQTRPAEHMTMYQVSTAVNKAVNDDPSLLQPADTGHTLFE